MTWFMLLAMSATCLSVGKWNGHIAHDQSCCHLYFLYGAMQKVFKGLIPNFFSRFSDHLIPEGQRLKRQHEQHAGVFSSIYFLHVPFLVTHAPLMAIGGVMFNEFTFNRFTFTRSAAIFVLCCRTIKCPRIGIEPRVVRLDIALA